MKQDQVAIIELEDDTLDVQDSSFNCQLNEKDITFEIKINNKLISSKSQYLPGFINIKLEDVQVQKGADLICLIDKSGSMKEGDKMIKLKNSLINLLDILTDKDRLQIIVFDDNAKKLTPFKKMNNPNKQQMKKIINYIEAEGGTNIGMATEIALKSLCNRKQRNEVTSIFILSDGNDEKAENALKQQLQNLVRKDFTINSLGYGENHNGRMMKTLCELGNGFYQYIKEIKDFQNFFTKLYGGLVSTVGQISIEANCFPAPPFQDIHISKTIGNHWISVQNQRQYQIEILQMPSGQKRDFGFEIAIPKIYQNINDQNRDVKIMEATLQLKNSFNQIVCTKHAQLNIKFYNEDENQIIRNINDQDQEVTEQLEEFQILEVIQGAYENTQQNKMKEAKDMLNDKIVMQLQEKLIIIGFFFNFTIQMDTDQNPNKNNLKEVLQNIIKETEKSKPDMNAIIYEIKKMENQQDQKNQLQEKLIERVQKNQVQNQQQDKQFEDEFKIRQKLKNNIEREETSFDRVYPKKKQFKIEKEYDLTQDIDFQIKTQYTVLKLSNYSQQYLPGIISIKAKEGFNFQPEISRAAVDLICLIDKGQSMQGQKIQMVKQTLNALIDYLSPKDRLQLITFNESTQVLIPQLETIQNNQKDQIKNLIQSIQVNGKTSIEGATDFAFFSLRSRNRRNNISTIFIFSDCEDTQVLRKVEAQLQSVYEKFSINTFGLGSNQNSFLMEKLSNLGKGNHYFVNDITQLEKISLDALKFLNHAVEQKIEIFTQCQPASPFQDILIHQTYGDAWIPKQDQRQYNIEISELQGGERKDFAFEIEIPRFYQKLDDKNRRPLIMEAELKITNPTTGFTYVKYSRLKITFFNEDEQNYDVTVQHNRLKALEIIKQAIGLCESRQHQEAQQILKDMLLQLKANSIIAALCQGLIKDLEQAIKEADQKNYRGDGKKHLIEVILKYENQQCVTFGDI